MADNDTYLTCSATAPDELDVTVSGILVGKVTSETVPAGSTTWTQTGVTGLGWGRMISDADGSNLFSVKSSRLYISTDSGANWVETRPVGDLNKSWSGIATDSTGTTLLAGIGTGRLYLTTDGGENWAETQPVGDADANWVACASDSDGSNLVACAYGGGVYIYSGAAWGAAALSPKNWFDVVSDADGSNLLAGVTSARLWKYSGGAWAETQPKGDANGIWTGIATDDDGSNLIACTGGSSTVTGYVYTTSDSGSNWAETSMGYPAKYYNNVASDSDGSNLLVASSDASAAHYGQIYQSLNSGTTWGSISTGSHWWLKCGSDADGSFLLANERLGDGTQKWWKIVYTAGSYSSGDTYLTCSSTDPDLLDVYVDATQVGRFTSETETTGSGNTYIDCDTPDKLRIYVDAELVLEGDDA